MQGVFVPTFQSAAVYACLAAIYGGLLVARRQPPSERLHKYAALALLDMEANFLLNKAYRYTSITSVTLLDCWTIPGSVLLCVAADLPYATIASVSLGRDRLSTLR